MSFFFNLNFDQGSSCTQPTRRPIVSFLFFFFVSYVCHLASPEILNIGMNKLNHICNVPRFIGVRLTFVSRSSHVFFS